MNDDIVEELEEIKGPVAILANRWTRIVAFILDLLLVMAITLAVIGFFIIPRYPSAVTEFRRLTTESSEIRKDLMKKMTPQLEEMLEVGHMTILLIFWIYFSASEIFMKGGSLGKAIFSIRVVNEKTLDPPGIFDSIIRSGIKSFSLLAWTPVLTVNYLIFFFTKKGQAGHDFLSRTIVIQGQLETNNEELEEEEENWK